MKKLYLLQVQEGEGFPFEDLYYPTKKELDNVVEQASRNKRIYINEENATTEWKHHTPLYHQDAGRDYLIVFKMRIFKMIKRVTKEY